MLNNLRAELSRKGLEPTGAVSDCLGITKKTAKKKLERSAAFTVPEAIKILETFFGDENNNFAFEDLFMPTHT